MKPGFLISVGFPLLFAVMASFFLVIGLRGIVSKRPFVISARWLLILVVLGFAPGMLQSLQFPRITGEPGMLVALHLLVPIMLLVVLIFLYFTLRGYTAFGVTDISFRDGLTHSLKKLNLPYRGDALYGEAADPWSRSSGGCSIMDRNRPTEDKTAAIQHDAERYRESNERILPEWRSIRDELNLLHILFHHGSNACAPRRSLLVCFQINLLRE